MKFTTIAKNRLKDLSTTAKTALGIPHTRPEATVRREIAGIKEADVAEQRIGLIAQATGKPADVVRGFVAAFQAEPWSKHTWDDAREYGLYGSPVMDVISLYTLAHALEPALCVETGTASGMSATAVLSYLVKREDGFLHSIDVADPRIPQYGALIPEDYQNHWQLHLQQNTPLLPGLLDELGEIDFFYHDSVHTVEHMQWEYELGWQKLKRGGCLGSHDILRSTAFSDFQKTHKEQIAGGGTIGNFGFLIKR